MAMESTCKLQVGKDHYDGRVRMDGDHIDFSGQTKFRFRLNETRNARCEDDTILFSFHGNGVSIKLGQTRMAQTWLEHILHPQTLADKLGIRDGHTINVLNLDEDDLRGHLDDKKARVATYNGDASDLILLGVDRPSELRQLESLGENIPANGAIWVILPKSVRTITRANVLAAAREAGLRYADEVIDFSETQTAYKVIRPPLTDARSRFAAAARAK